MNELAAAKTPIHTITVPAKASPNPSGKNGITRTLERSGGASEPAELAITASKISVAR